MTIINDFDIWGDGNGWSAGIDAGMGGHGNGWCSGSGSGYDIKGLNENLYFTFQGNGVGSRFGWGEGDGGGAANSHDKINKTNLNRFAYNKK